MDLAALLVQDVLQFLATVDHDLRPQIADLRLPVEVSLLVGSQVAGLRKTLAAVRVVAHVRLFAGVRAQMRAKIEVK